MGITSARTFFFRPNSVLTLVESPIQGMKRCTWRNFVCTFTIMYVFSWQSNKASELTHVTAVVSFMGDFLHVCTMEQESIMFCIQGQIFHFLKEELPVATGEIFSGPTLGSVESQKPHQSRYLKHHCSQMWSCILLATTYFHMPSHASY